MIIYPSLQCNTTVALFIKPDHICVYHQNHIKLAGRVCIDCTIRASVMSRRDRRNDRYVMINPLYIKSVVEPTHSCIERTSEQLVVGYKVESKL
jgi:hypothetical protein